MATSVRESPALGEALGARRSAAQEAQLRMLHWFDLGTSLWSPVTVLAIALVPYLIVVESFERSARVAVPLMQGFGLLMAAWFAGLLVWRLVSPRGRTLRRLRHEGRELTDEVGRGLSVVHDPSVRERLVDAAARAEAAMAGADAPTLERELKTLADQAGRAIPAFRKQSVLGVGLGFTKALAVALLIRTIFIEPFRIPSGSMLPTLQIGDQIFVNKFIYGVRIPFTNWVPFVIVRKPERGDVVVFENPVTGQDYIKRIIGIPGDVLEFRGDQILLNGKAVPGHLVDPRVEVWDANDDRPWRQNWQELWTETVGSREHPVLHFPTRAMNPQEEPFRVPDGQVFVMGDNRDNSSDSRFGLGGTSRGIVCVPYGNIKGKAMIIWLSLSHGGLGSGLFGETGLRADRFFLPVR